MDRSSLQGRSSAGLEKYTLSESIRFDRRVVESLRAMLASGQADATPVGYQDNEDELTRLFRMKVSEFLNVSFEYIDISPYEGTMISWKKHRKICLDINSSPSYNLLTMAHFVAHMALGHIQDDQPFVLIKSPFCYENLKLEKKANNFARAMLSGRRVPISVEDERENFREIWRSVREWKIKSDSRKAKIHRILDSLGMIPGYNSIRSLSIVDLVLDRVKVLIRY